MTDKKYETGNDRQKTTLDFKQRIIDLMANAQPLPDVGIYDEPVRYFKANEQWCAVIFGWLAWLEDIAGWQDAEDENYQGIQQILIFEEGIDVADPISTYEAIRDGIYDAFNGLAAQIVSGSKGGFSVDADGNVTIGAGAGAGNLPEDDPLTPLDESAAARSGGCNAIRLGINKLFSQMDGFFTSGLPVATAKTRLKLLYTLNDVEADSFVDFYYTSYALTANPIVLSSALDSSLFCRGVGTQAIARYAYESHTPSGDVATIEALLPALGEQLNIWFSEGAEIPSIDYIGYSCVPVDPETFTWDSTRLNANAFQTGTETHKLNHRILVEVEGKVNHPSDGSYQDYFYHVASNGTKTFLTISTTQGTIQFNAPFGTIPQSKVPFESSGKYAVTMETTSAALASMRRIITNANQAPGTTGFILKLTDLGEILT